MNSIAWKARRKWRFAKAGCDQRRMIALACAGMLLCAASAQAGLPGQRVPLPLPRPADALINPAPPAAAQQPPAEAAPSEGRKTAAQPMAPAPPSACRLALTEAVAIAPSIPDIKGAGGCGGEDLVRLEAVVLPDQGRVPLKPAAMLRCDMASAVADWIRTDVTAMATGLGTRVSGLDNFNSYECRGRNRVAGAKISEHGRANAIDIRGITFANGQSVALTEVSASRDLREQVLGSVCERFHTVLGPGSDGYHEDHIHIDLAPRRNNYKICQWMVWDALPKVAPLLPADRPADAPSREVAAAAPVAPVADPAREPVPVPPAQPQAVPASEPPAKTVEAAVPLPERKPIAKPRKTKRQAARSRPFSPLDLFR